MARSNHTSALLAQRPHRRYNALSGEWVLVSPRRTTRPWQGRQELAPLERLSKYDEHCYLCPGNVRASGDRNPQYRSTYVFTNDYAALRPDQESEHVRSSELLRARTHAGTCRVICYSPRHDLTLARMPVAQVGEIVDTWVEQAIELSAKWAWVQIFENKGEMMGCSNPHPHGQVWAGDFIPNEAQKELSQQRSWAADHANPLLLSYAELEARAEERVVVMNAHWLVVVPWWAVWPFETLLLPRRAMTGLHEMEIAERDALPDILGRLLRGYDRLFDVSFPYSFGWHAAPGAFNSNARVEGWQLHAHFYPPLLRSALVKKFMVGYEMLSEVQRDITPEEAAEQLRAVIPQTEC